MKNKGLAVPYVVWMAIFVVAPLILVVIYAFHDGSRFTLDNFRVMGTYAAVFGRSFLLAAIATLVCILIGYPVAWFLAREGPGLRRIATILIMLPMWMNFLLRTYSWMSILENTGLLNTLFQKIGLISLVNHVFGTNFTYFSHDQHAGSHCAGHGIQLSALYDPAHLHGH
jgi:ABC-type spermidine/putrescine transport system, permease component I